MLHKFDISLLLAYLTYKIVNITSGFFVPIMLLKSPVICFGAMLWTPAYYTQIMFHNFAFPFSYFEYILLLMNFTSVYSFAMA